MVKHAVLALGVLTAAATSAAAQDFGTDWIDRITIELTQERGPLAARPWEWSATGGVAYYFDNNVYLMEDDEVSDSIVIPFGRFTLNYAEPRFEFTADALVNYKWYVDDDNEPNGGIPDSTDGASDDEERFYVRARQAASRYSLEVAEVFQRVSDPISVLYTERAERTVSNTLPRIEFDLNRQWSIEGSADYQILRYDDGDLGRSIENNSVRAQGSLVFKTARGYDLLAQVGWQDISYRNDQSVGAPPDAFGWYVRLGWRGELIERLYVEAFVGYDHIESDYFAGTSEDQEDNTTGANAALRYELTETVKISAEYARVFAFAGAGDPYQRVDRGWLLVDAELAPEFGLKLRGQYDHSMSALSTERNYLSAGGALWWKALPWMILDAGVTIRSGDTETQDATIDTEFDNLIFHFGLAASY